jgi:hypothetical protein
MYVSFDPDIDYKKPFPDKDYIDEFTFNLTENGLYQPTFDKSALTIIDKLEPKSFLSKYNFIRLHTVMTPHGWGDAFYVHEKI